MRANLGILGFMLATSTAAIGFTACGNSVAEVTGGTGGGATGTGGSQSTTSTTVTVSSSSGNSTTSSTSSSSSGGGDECQTACAHVKDCVGFDACNQGFNFDCSNPQYECAAKCINNLSCGDINFQSVPACLQQCAPQDAGPIDAGDPCMNACAHVQQCFGIDLCAQIGMQLDCSNPQYACMADCINSKTCSDIGFTTFQACQAQCQGTMTDAGPPPPDAGPPPTDAGIGNAQACQQCTQQGCFQALAGCFQTPTCASQNPQNQTWLSCALACNQQNATPACYKACDTQYPNAAQGYQPVYACECTKCAAECGSISDPCGMH